MAVVKPLYVDSGNLREMDTTMVNQLVDQAVYQYSLSPSVALSVVSSGGSLSAITDTRKQAGAQSTSSTCLLYTSPSPRDAHESRMPSSA